MISRLQYITQYIPGITHAQLTKEACEAGVNWIQLRVKDKNDEEWREIAFEVKQVCDIYKATLIINDNVPIAKEIGAHGVHLGKTDMSPKEARSILGSNFIIGGTANTFDDVRELNKQGVDYIGLGPFRFTGTKKNLSPILGLEGYKQITKQCLLHNITAPIIAIGGITSTDVENIAEIGMYGVAISSHITNSMNKKETVQKLIMSISTTTRIITSSSPDNYRNEMERNNSIKTWDH